MSDGIDMKPIEEAFDVRVITLGRGEFVAGSYVRDGLASLCFGPAPDPHAPGEPVSLEVAKFATRNGAVVISFADPAAMFRVIAMIIDAAALAGLSDEISALLDKRP